MFEVLAIDGGYFYAGVVLEKGRVVEVAPILRRRLMGATRKYVFDLSRKCGWKILVVIKERTNDENKGTSSHRWTN